MLDPTKFLTPEEDGLAIRESHYHAQLKFKALEYYLEIANGAMKEKDWSALRYIDLQAGPGKNRIGSTIVLGSPLIALTAKYPPTEFVLNEYNEQEPDLWLALSERISVSPLASTVTLYQADVNEIVNVVCESIEQKDRLARSEGRWPSLNYAFLDPEGLELHWETVKKLAAIDRMDLIINFSTSGLVRVIGSGGNEAKLHQFFGTDEWKTIYDPQQSPAQRRQALIDFYRSNLARFGYKIEIEEEHIPVKNSRNAEVYSLIYASKHPLGNKFWNRVAKAVQPPKLPGF